jgi:hypothetical protein
MQIYMPDLTALSDVNLPEFNLGTLGLLLVTAGVVAAVFQYIRGWDKRKGFRMVLKDRNDKIHAIWLEIIQDGVDARLASGKISQKEANEMFADAAKKMKLLDLIPKKRLAPMVKETLKRDRAARKLAHGTEYPALDKSKENSAKPTFSQRLGKAAGKFR